MLDDDYHIVDEQADGGGHAAQGHDVESLPENLEQERGDCEHDRNGDRRNHRNLPAAQENQEDDCGDEHADDHGIAHAGRRSRDQFALVVPPVQMHAFRNHLGVRGELCRDLVRDGDGIAARLLVDVEKDRLTAVSAHADPARNDRGLDACDVVQPHYAVGPALDDDIADALRALELAVGDGQVKLVMIRDPSHGIEHVLRGYGLGYVGERQSQRMHSRGVYVDVVFGDLPTLHLDVGHARNARKQWPYLVLGQVPQGNWRQRLGGEAVSGDRIQRRFHAPDVESRSRRYLGQCPAYRALDLQLLAHHVGAPLEVGNDLGRAAAGGGMDVDHAGNAPHGEFHRPGDLQFHALGGPVARAQAHADARKLHMGKQRDGETECTIESARGQHDGQEDQ